MMIEQQRSKRGRPSNSQKSINHNHNDHEIMKKKKTNNYDNEMMKKRDKDHLHHKNHPNNNIPSHNYNHHPSTSTSSSSSSSLFKREEVPMSELILAAKRRKAELQNTIFLDKESLQKERESMRLKLQKIEKEATPPEQNLMALMELEKLCGYKSSLYHILD
ncbi:uncharacterized protein LOC133029247 [Cannabis sativa]|uniref:uncharacterized protein LOC133029247 n=1 Tax=Cannabis sativa TaxID=3483 RepID=UPI0029CA8B7B|nr:uncharacterized protein LOC133029247 [Cannabis sativa]